MKPSEALRKGIELRPNQAKHCFLTDDGLGSCALGAIYEGFHGKVTMKSQHMGIAQKLVELEKAFPGLGVVQKGTVSEMNDFRGKTREQIADWLESEGL